MCFEGSSISSFTPRHTVTSGSFAGADIITHFAPASRCFEADALSVNLPVDSRTTSTPRLFHGSFSGSVTARIFISFPLTFMPLSVTFTSALNIPCTESYLSRCARVFASVRSFIATISKSLHDALALKKTLPILPNPLIATLTDIKILLVLPLINH